ncbi:MAG: fucose isomerase, partial [Verrucomicrobia bacterium]|nr:fucose isomerase [Verrucomicrobiota bacterium]
MKITLIANGDLRESANRVCWENQAEMEAALTGVVTTFGHDLVRAHAYNEARGHGFIGSQREGMDVFASIDPEKPIIVAEAVWQYSHHVLHGLISHKAPIMTVANWSGTWPGLVGMLNLNGSLTKAGVKYSTLWSEDFSDDLFLNGLKSWLDVGEVIHPSAHVSSFNADVVNGKASDVADELASELQSRKAIMGVFDEGCMGMFNAIIPDHLLFQTGVYKERLSQSALYAGMREVSDEEATATFQWIQDKGFNFHFGTDEATELTEAQVLEQCKMYIAACRIGDFYGCDALGIQYQQGLKDLCPASDLVEGLLNSTDRPPVTNDNGEVIKAGKPFTHFNEVDECAGLDGLLTQRVHDALGQPPENTLHDLRWGDPDKSGTTDEYVWVFLISGSVPIEHNTDGYAGSHGYRQPPMYFWKGGSTLQGVSHAGEIIWSRIWIDGSVSGGKLCMDLGRGKAIELPEAETRRRLEATTPQWPIMHAVTYGVSRDQMMARHKANHIQVAYANSSEEADLCLQTKAALADKLGLEVTLCGT